MATEEIGPSEDEILRRHKKNAVTLRRKRVSWAAYLRKRIHF